VEQPKDFELPRAERRPERDDTLVGILVIGVLGIIVGVIGTLSVLFLLQ
jgi:hypothetical protein